MSSIQSLVTNINKSHRICRYRLCGKTFYLKYHGDNSSFCSEECKSDRNKERKFKRRNKAKHPRSLKSLKNAYRKLLKENKELKSKANKHFKTGFYTSDEWRSLRYKVIKHFGRKCHSCGTTSKEIHVDHIKPRSKYPELELEFSNLQILCIDCNLGKSNKDETDWR